MLEANLVPTLFRALELLKARGNRDFSVFLPFGTISEYTLSSGKGGSGKSGIEVDFLILTPKMNDREVDSDPLTYPEDPGTAGE